MDTEKAFSESNADTEAVITARFTPTGIVVVNSADEITHDLITEFASWIGTSASKETVMGYVATMNKYCIGRRIELVNDKNFLINFQHEMKERKLSAATIMRHIAAVKRFLRFLNEKYDMPIINLDVIKCHKPDRPNPTFLTLEEIEKIRQVPVRTIMELRNRTLFEFLLDTGCRVSEALGINWQDIDFDKGEVKVLGKGSKTRIVFLHNSADWIQQYLESRKSDAQPLFLTIQKLNRLNREHAAIAIKELGKKAGITKDVHPHMLRHTFGTYLIWNNADARTVQVMMGHEDVDTTMKYYVAVTEERMKAAHKGFGLVMGGSKPQAGMEYPLYK